MIMTILNGEKIALNIYEIQMFATTKMQYKKITGRDICCLGLWKVYNEMQTTNRIQTNNSNGMTAIELKRKCMKCLNEKVTQMCDVK